MKSKNSILVLVLALWVVIWLHCRYIPEGLAVIDEKKIMLPVETVLEESVAESPTEEEIVEENSMEDSMPDEDSAVEADETESVRAEEDESVQEEFAAFAEEVVLSDSETVYTFSELKAALESEVTTTIYLGNDITMESGGIIISSSKPSLVIDGVNPLDSTATIHTLTDYNSDLQGQTITLRSNTGPKSITLRNLVIYGKNWYGPVSVYDAAQNVTTSYENIEYYGPQLVCNRNGTTKLKDALIQIGRFGGTSAPNEVGEVGGVILEGRIDISQVESQVNEIFYFPLKSGAIEVKSNSVVNVSTYGSYSGFIYSNYNVAFTVRSNARFTYTGPSQFWESTAAFSEMTVEDDAKVHITFTGTKISAMLRVLGPLYVGPGAELHLIGASGGYGNLRMGGNATFDDPGSVLLYNPPLRTVVYANAANMAIGAQQVNYWTVAGPGGFDDLPLYRWRKADGSLFTMNGTVTAELAGNFGAIASNYLPEDASGAGAPNNSNFNLINSRVIAFGRLEIEAVYEYQSQTAARVTGTTKPLAALTLTYTDEAGSEVHYNTAADEVGVFSVDLPGPLLDDTAITIRSSYQYLLTEQTIYTRKNILQFESVPEEMFFSSTGLSAKAWTVGRVEPAWKLAVYDSRGTGLEWTLTARLVNELTPHKAGRPILEGAIVFVDNTGKATILDTNTATLIWRHTATGDVEVVPVSWNADKGILLAVKPGTAFADTVYTATIAWILSDAP